MKKLTRTGFVLFAAGVCAVVAVGMTASVAEAKRPGGGINCPDVWDPVICSNGQVYSNFCYASVAGATGCVRLGGEVE